MITQDQLKEILHYDPETGHFTWLIACAGRPAGRRAGTLDTRGYRVISVAGKRNQKEHRLAYLYMTGSIPRMIDHDNGRKDDNSWGNICPTDPLRNNRNAARRRDNSSGLTGVHWCSRRNRWVVQAGTSRGRVQKTFKDLLGAACFRKSLQIQEGYHPNHGAR